MKAKIDELVNKVEEIRKDRKKWRQCSPDHPPCGICGKIIRGWVYRDYPSPDFEIAYHERCLGLSNDDNDDDEIDIEGIIIQCVNCEFFDRCEHISAEEKDALSSKYSFEGALDIQAKAMDKQAEAREKKKFTFEHQHSKECYSFSDALEWKAIGMMNGELLIAGKIPDTATIGNILTGEQYDTKDYGVSLKILYCPFCGKQLDEG